MTRTPSTRIGSRPVAGADRPARATASKQRPAPEGKTTPGVESARRVLQILLMFSEDRLEVTIDDVAKLHDMSLPSAYRYMALLRELQLVQEARGGAFVLTPKIQELAAASERSIDLERVARPVLERLMLATNETAFILRRVRERAVFLFSAQPERALTLSFRGGNTTPLHRGAVAKVLLAYAPGGFRQRYLTKNVSPDAESTRLQRELVEIQKNGFAESESEVDEGIWGGAVPIHVAGMAVASLSIAGPAFRIDADKRALIRRLLGEAAKEITALADGRKV